MLRELMEEQKEPIFTVCGRLVRKSLIQAHVVGKKSRFNSLWFSMSRMMVLNAEQKSTNNILT